LEDNSGLTHATGCIPTPKLHQCPGISLVNGSEVCYVVVVVSSLLAY